MKVRQRLFISFAAILILFVVQSIMVIMLVEYKDDLAEDEAFITQKNQEIARVISEHDIWQRDVVEYISDNSTIKIKNKEEETAFGLWYMTFVNSGYYVTLADELKAFIQDAKEAHDTLLTASREIKFTATLSEQNDIYRRKIKNSKVNVKQPLTKFINAQLKEYNRINQRLLFVSSLLMWIQIIVLIFSTLVSAFLAFHISKYIDSSLKAVVLAITHVSRGFLNSRIGSVKNDEFGTLSVAFNEFLEKLREVVRSSRDVSDTLVEITGGMNSTISDFSLNTQTNAAASEEIASSSEAINGGMQGIVENTEDQYKLVNDFTGKLVALTDSIREMMQRFSGVSSVTDSITGSAQEAGESLAMMQQVMEQIAASSSRIINVINIISDISEEINLLSLNASIESARAGSAGKGFAVVAEEISSLAEQTSKSVKEIEQEIRMNNSDTEEGVETVVRTSDVIETMINQIDQLSVVMKEIYSFMETEIETNEHVISMVDQVNNSISDIEESMSAQKDAVDEISRSIQDISQAAQKNVESVVNMNDQSNEVEEKAVEMRKNLLFFKLEEDPK